METRPGRRRVRALLQSAEFGLLVILQAVAMIGALASLLALAACDQAPRRQPAAPANASALATEPLGRPSFGVTGAELLDRLEAAAGVRRLGVVHRSTRRDSLTQGEILTVGRTAATTAVYTLPGGGAWQARVLYGSGDRCGRPATSEIRRLVETVSPAAGPDVAAAASRDLSSAEAIGAQHEVSVPGARISITPNCVTGINLVAQP